jgi:hypothetical protein
MVLPFRLILFQSYFLLIAVAVEAFILYRRLQTSRKKSVQYAAFMNVLAHVCGWIVFFVLLPLFPEEFKAQVISYIFYNRFLSGLPVDRPIILVTSVAVMIFFGAYLLKLKGLEILEFYVEFMPARDKNRGTDNSEQSFFQRLTSGENTFNLARLLVGAGILNKTLDKKRPRYDYLFTRWQAISIFWAHLTSSSAILLILLWREIALRYRG